MMSEGMKAWERDFRRAQAKMARFDAIVAQCEKCPAGTDCDSCDVLPRLAELGKA